MVEIQSYYGFLVGIWEKQQGNANEEIKSSDDLDEEQRKLILNRYFKEQANALKEDGDGTSSPVRV